MNGPASRSPPHPESSPSGHEGANARAAAEEVVGRALAFARAGNPAGAIAQLVDFAESIGDEAGEDLMADAAWLGRYRSACTECYAAWILRMEADELAAVLARPRCGERGFRAAAGADAVNAYDRVAAIFLHCDFTDCQSFVLVGSGQLPVTALHVHDLTTISQLVCIDPRPEAAASVRRLADWLDSSRLVPHCGFGQDYDFGQAGVIYVANMVSPKSQVIRRILETAPSHARIILRDPYSLGRLWADSGEISLDPRLRVMARGGPSRYLSRDLFLGRSDPASDT